MKSFKAVPDEVENCGLWSGGPQLTRLNDQLDRYLQRYCRHIAEQLLSPHSKRAYISRVRQFLIYVSETDSGLGALTPTALCSAVLRYLDHLKHTLRAKPSSYNAIVSTLRDFLSLIGEKAPAIAREKVPLVQSRTLSPEEQTRYVQAIARRRDVRDRALGYLFFYTGIRVGECASLDIDNVQIGIDVVEIKIGKSPRLRTVPLNDIAREAVLSWLLQRLAAPVSEVAGDALFLNKQGRRLSSFGIERVIRKIGLSTGLVVSPQVLRNTFLSECSKKKHGDGG